jgi:hypothetical protein
MRKLGRPDKGVSSIRPLTQKEREITGWENGVYVGYDGVKVVFYKKSGTGFSPCGTDKCHKLAYWWDGNV